MAPAEDNLSQILIMFSIFKRSTSKQSSFNSYIGAASALAVVLVLFYYLSRIN